MTTLTTQKVIGFDFGHGDTALAWVGVHTTTDAPTLLEIYNEKKQVTALAYDPKQVVKEAKFRSQQEGIVIGDRAVQRRNAQNLKIAFKRRPVDEVEYQKTMRDFATAIYEHLVQSEQIGSDHNNLFFIGCPSGWKESDRQKYEQLLKAPNTPIKQLTVCAESRAALMHSVESNQLKIEQLRGAILVIDIGSSTTDFTLVTGKSEHNITDFGEDLGASLIDKAILANSLDHHPQVVELKGALAKYPQFKNRCEYLCRRVKEIYFNDPSRYEDADNYVQFGYEDFNRQLPFIFEPKVNKQTMEQLLQRPLTELNGRTWPNAFREQLQRVKQELTKQNVQPKALLLTGGASRMDFIKPLCQDIFPGVACIQDSAPEHAIALGLARWGRVDIRTKRFTDEINALLNQVVPPLVQQNLHKLVDAVAETLTDGLIEDVMPAGMRRWRERELITLNDLEPHLHNCTKKWLQSSAADDKIAKKMDAWIRPLQEELNGKLSEISRRYNLPLNALYVKSGIMPNSTSLHSISIQDPTVLTDLVNGLIMIVVGIIVGVVAVAVGTSGPIGWALAFLAWAISSGALMEGAEIQIKQADIPTWVRKAILSDARIKEKIAEKRSEIHSNMQKILSAEELRNRLSDELIDELKTEARKAADKQRLLIT